MTGKRTTEEPQARTKKAGSKSGRTQFKGIDDFDDELWQLTEQSQDMIYYYDILSKMFIFADQTVATLYGQKEDTKRFLTAKSVLHRIHPEDRENVKAMRDNSLKPSVSDGEVEYRFRDFSGNWRLLHDKWVVIRDKSGNAKAIVGTIQDVTSHKSLAESIRNSHEFYRAIFDETGTAMVVFDEDMTILLVNKKCEILTGYKKSVLEGGMKISDIIFKNDKDAVLSHYRSLRIDQSKALNKHEYRVMNRSGQIRNVISTIDLLPGTNKIIASILDITEQKFIESELRKSKDRYRQLADSLPQIIFELDTRGRFTFVNRAALEITGYLQEEFARGFYVYDKFIPADKKRIKAALPKLLAGQTNTGQVYTALRKDGSTFPLYAYSSPIIRDGIVVGSLGVAVDITDLKKIEEALLASETRYRTLIETSPDGIAVADLTGKISMANQKLLELHRFAGSEEVMGGNVFDMIAPDDRPRARENTHEIVNNRSQENIEYTLLRKDGTRFIGAVSSSVIVDPSGIANEFITITRDVTDKRLMEDALRDSEERFRSIYEQAAVGVIIMDKEGCIVKSNPAFCGMTGYTEEELINQSIFKLSHPEDRVKEIEGVRRLQSGMANTFSHEKRYFRKDGEAIWVHLTVSMLRYKDRQFHALIGVAQDISKRKLAIDALRESEERFYKIVELTSDCIWEIDENAHFTYVGRSVKDFLGYTSEEMLGKPLLEIIHPEEVEKYGEALRSFWERRQAVTFYEAIITSKDMRKNYIEISGTPIFDIRGMFKGYRGVVRNITERKTAEDLLKNREEELHAKTASLEESNAALKVLLQHRKKEEEDLGQKIITNVKEIVQPYIDKLKMSGLDQQKNALLKIIESNLVDITSPFLHTVKLKYSHLTPTEIRMLSLIKEGMTSKEIASLMNISTRAVEFHRYRIRGKLGINNKKTNLRSHLMSQ